MTIVLTHQPYRRMVRILRQFEGWRCLWRLPVAVLAYCITWVLPLAGSVAGIYIGADLSLAQVVLGVATTTASVSAARIISSRKPWRAVVSKRLWTYERPSPATSVNTLIERDGLNGAERALRRDQLNPARVLFIGAPPPDAPNLTRQITVEEPEAHMRSRSDDDRVIRIARTLADAGIRARVAGVDVM